MEYLGRLDHQVKIHGFRIELGEVEAALTAQPEIRAAAVLVKGDGPAGRLVAYLVTSGEADWAARLRSRLPAHMVPTQYVVLDRLPVTSNGKLDRAALPDPAAPAHDARTGEPPRTYAEEAVARIWRQVLGTGELAVDDEFFALGGDSILSLKVVARLRADGWAVTLADLFAFRTVRALAAHLDQQRQHGTAPGSDQRSGAFGLLSAADRERLERDYGGAQ